MKFQSFNVFKSAATGGFTLPEVSIAAAVCMIGMVGILALLPTALQGARDAGDHTMAARIAAGEIAQYRAAAANTIWNPNPPAVTVIPPWNNANHYYDSSGAGVKSTETTKQYFQTFLTLCTHSNDGAVMYSRTLGVDLIVRVQWPSQNIGSSNPKYTEYYLASIARMER
jgi:uncharacterized protein (TIGR02598 family)